MAYKYVDFRKVQENQKIVLGTLVRELTTYEQHTSSRFDLVHAHQFNAVVSYFDNSLSKTFLFKSTTLVPDAILMNYIYKKKKNSKIPVEVIVDKENYSNYIVLIDKALEEYLGSERNWVLKKIT